ncbi:MAG: CADD family putative folate metabolism protein [Myxococcaceae bacterium]|nr:CADD family putative folate metabolism protein [Myxococcaceae bacterium]
MKLIDRLNAVIAEKHLLKHPFYQAWTEGRLSRDVLRRYAGQYFAQVDSFPRFVSTVHSRCPEIEARKVLTENLADEEIHGTDHPELWLRFAEGLGAERAEVKGQTQLPTTKSMVDTFFSLANQDWTAGLCALYAYESQVPEVSKSKVDGLKKFYGVNDDRTLSFFTVHQHYDVEHSRKVGELLEKYADGDKAVEATRQAADALWKFLDGISHEAGIRCEMN